MSLRTTLPTTLRTALLGAALTALAAGCCPRGFKKKAPPPPPVVEPEPPPKPKPWELVDRTKLPEPTKASAWKPQPAQTFSLKNGMKVWFMAEKQAPLVSLSLILPYGAAVDPVKRAGLTTLLVDMLDEGAGEMTALQISETLQRLATDYGGSASRDAVYLKMHLLADKLEDSLKLLADIARRPTFPKDERKRRKEQHVAHALAKEAEPGTGRAHVIRRALFGDGYGALANAGTRSTLKKLRLYDVKKHYKALFAPTGATFVVVGAVDKERVSRALDLYFGDWQGAPTVKYPEVTTDPVEAGIHLVDYPGSTQSAIAVARRAAPFPTPDYFDALVFDWIIGGAFTSRINMNLREDKGYTYGARTIFVRDKRAGIFLAYSKVKGDKTKESLLEILKELDGIRGAKPISQEEFENARGGLLKGFPGRFEKMDDVGEQLNALAQYELPPDWLARWPGNVQGVSLVGAQTVAQKVASPDGVVLVVAGDRKKLEASLRELGKPMFFYDVEGKRLKK